MNFSEKSAEWLQGHPLHSPVFVDSATPVPAQRAPESQTNVGQLLQAILEELRRINNTPREGAASSCEIKFLAPTKDHPRGTPQPVVKMYAGSPVPVTEAIEAYGRAIREAVDGQMAGWAATVEALKA